MLCHLNIRQPREVDVCVMKLKGLKFNKFSLAKQG
jgi:hypothetical protein